MSFKDELLAVLSSLDEFTTDMLAHRLSIGPKRYPAYYTSLRRLESAKLVKKKKRGKIIAISLTEKGKDLIKRRAMAKKRSDGLSTIIIFDIPEEKKRAREGLRRYLLKQGYLPLQESVLISPYYVTKELKEVLREYGVTENITVISGRVDYERI